MREKQGKRQWEVVLVEERDDISFAGKGPSHRRSILRQNPSAAGVRSNHLRRY